MTERNPVTVWVVVHKALSDHSSQMGNPVTMHTAVIPENTALKRASGHSG